MGFDKLFELINGAASSTVGPREAMSSTVLAKAAPRPMTADTDSMESDSMVSKNIKIAVAAYSIQRRVLETLHDVLQASLREDHAMDLWRFKRSLKDYAVTARVKRRLDSKRELCTGYSCFGGPTSYEELVSSACTFVHHKLKIAKFMLLQAKEETAAAKECKEQLDGLRKEFGDCIVPERNGGVGEADCAGEQRALLAEWGLSDTGTEKDERGWEDDLRDMVRLSVKKRREEKARSRWAALRNKSAEAGRVLTHTRPRSLSAVLESSKEE